MAAKGAFLHHISRETADLNRLAKFYQEILGFERIESPYFAEMEVIWLRVPNTALSMHLIERNPQSKLPESPWTSTAPIADPRNLPRGHHLCFGVSNYDSLLQTLKANFFYS
ncbi:hypothetical protein MRB53_020278 [Persea americana]|uniref:Uncharacterized protein n=1 Tax=Persea americana TaxID=3435 RepID=A0ACC2L0Q9_PERAE|nr:hypothetical protein MRB53_020278 [Persea americana]